MGEAEEAIEALALPEAVPASGGEGVAASSREGVRVPEGDPEALWQAEVEGVRPALLLKNGVGQGKGEAVLQVLATVENEETALGERVGEVSAELDGKSLG